MLVPPRPASTAFSAMMPLDATLLGVDVSVIAAVATVASVLVAAYAIRAQVRSSQRTTEAQIEAVRDTADAQIKATQATTEAQIKNSQAVTAVDILFRLIDRWESNDMIGERKIAARKALSREEAPEVNHVLGFFELVGYLLKAQAIRLEGVWVNLSNDAIFTWYAYYDLTIKEDQSTDQTLWEDFDSLVHTLADISKKRGEPEVEYHPDEPAWKRYLEDEAALGVTPATRES